jgi:hypothetical protein
MRAHAVFCLELKWRTEGARGGDDVKKPHASEVRKAAVAFVLEVKSA